jgi:hypothetical protein
VDGILFNLSKNMANLAELAGKRTVASLEKVEVKGFGGNPP